MESVVSKVINNKRCIDNKKEIINYVIKIKNQLINLQSQINREYKQDTTIDHIKLNFGIFSFLTNKDRNSLRFIFKPFKVDNGIYLRIGMFNSEMKFFDKNGKPIIIPNNYCKLSDLAKDLPNLLHSEKVLIDILIEKCKKQESIDSIINMYNLIRDVNILDENSIKLIKKSS